MKFAQANYSCRLNKNIHLNSGHRNVGLTSNSCKSSSLVYASSRRDFPVRMRCVYNCFSASSERTSSEATFSEVLFPFKLEDEAAIYSFPSKRRKRRDILWKSKTNEPQYANAIENLLKQ